MHATSSEQRRIASRLGTFAPPTGLAHRCLPEYFSGIVLGVSVAGFCTSLIWPVRFYLGSTGILLLYLLAVFLVASGARRNAAITTALASAAGYAYFFAPPIFSLAVAKTENLIGLVAMLLVASITSALVEKFRSQRDLARQRELQAGMLFRISQALAKARQTSELTESLVSTLYEEFRACAVVLLADDAGRLRYPSAPPSPESLRRADLIVAEPARISASPRVLAGTMPRQCKIFIDLHGSAGSLGVLAMACDEEPAQALHQLECLDMFGSLVGQALERVRLGEQAREASIQAESEALRNSLLSEISHDLRTPLTRIMGAASVLAEREGLMKPEDRRDFLRSIQDEAERMSGLMAKILDMARISAGKVALHHEWNTVEEIVGGALNSLERSLGLRAVHIDLPEDLPFLWVDSVLVQQVLINLIDNAVKYSPEGSPIDIGATRHPEGIEIRVADRGPGIPSGLERRIFETFYRVDAESTMVGVGLALSLCRAIVQAHGGRICVANRLGGGASFCVNLPTHEAPCFDTGDRR